MYSESRKNENIFYYRWPGRAHNARVWNQSPLHDDLDELCYFPNQLIAETYHLLGDSAYPVVKSFDGTFQHQG